MKQNNLKSHDHYFKKSMARIKVAQEFFANNLPAEVLQSVDLNTLKPVPTNFIDNTLGEGILDLLYAVNIKNSDGYFWLICEHQSIPDKQMALRIQKYMLRICSDHVKAKPGSKLPLIYPILLYSGKTKHNTPLSFWELFEVPDLAKSFFTKPIHLVEVSKLPESLLKKDSYVGLMLYFMQKIHEPDILPYIKEFAGVISEISEKDFSYIEDLLIYILEKGETKNTEEVLLTFKKIVSEDKRDKIMSIAEQLIEQGKNAGIQIGMEKGKLEGKLEGKIEVARRMLKEGFEISMVAKFSDLPVEEIKKINS